jgi:DNA mismatch endonuclease (patch repair protein)
MDSHIPKSRPEYWGPKLRQNRLRDRKNERCLRAAGWDILTVWECEVKNSETLSKRLVKFLAKRRAAAD